MPKHLIGALGLFIFICLAAVAARFVLPLMEAQKQSDTSAFGQAKGSIRIGGDGYAGYFPLNSPALQARMLRAGYRIEYQDDGGDYRSRSEKLKKEDIDLAVYTIDSYLLNAAAFNYPGSIIAVLSQSQGSDAIVANSQTIDSLDSLKNQPDTRIAYTANSPSHHLLKTVGSHFGLPHLLDAQATWSQSTDGSAQAWQQLQAGSVDVAVLWEPEVTLATSDPRFQKLLGTESTSGLIVDILVANRDYLQKDPEAITTLLKEYFLSLRAYRDDSEQFTQELSQWAQVSTAQATAMIDGIAWISLHQNAQNWYGISDTQQSAQFQLYQNIEFTLSTLVQAGDFQQSPLPNQDPRSILYGDFIQTLAQDTPTHAVPPNANIVFAQLPLNAWQQLQPVGTLEIPPVQFQLSSLELSDKSKTEMQHIASILDKYPSFRILIEGHTSPKGDASANQQLSQNRAQAVAQYMTRQFNLDPHRIQAIGHGSQRPLPRRSDESYRAYLNRLGRVEIKLVTNPI